MPCLTLEVNPNEKFDIDVNSFVRTMPLESAAFARVRQNIDFFFVPYRTVWHNFGNFFTGTDYKSRAFSDYGLSRASFPYLQASFAKDMGTTYLSKGDMFGYERIHGAVRLADMLEYGFSQEDYASSPVTGKPVTICKADFATSPLRACCYQKIYQDFYRNPLYEPMDASCYSLDGRDSAAISASSDLGIKLFELRYASWKRDYFTSIRPMFAGADFFSTQRLAAPDFPTVQYNSEVIASQSPTSGSNNQSFIYQSIEDHESVQISVNSLRSAYALDKLLHLMERAHDGSYSAQIQARFGVKPREDEDSSVFLGAYDSPIEINEVVSTADTAQFDSGSKTSGEVLGEIAGKGYSTANGHISFESKEHGVIMAIQSFVPEADYNSFGTDRANTMINRFDFFTPEFDNLGYEPIYQRELSNFGLTTEHSQPTGAVKALSSPNNILGYNVRFANYKVGIDKVFGAFKTPNTLNSWACPRIFTFSGFDFASGLTTAATKVDPLCLDSIFSVQGDGGTMDLSPDNDQFLSSLNFKITALRPMSIYGLPNV